MFWCSATLSQDRSSFITIEGTLRDAQGTPVAGASVIASGKNHPAPIETLTKADGTFLLILSDAGSYSVRAVKIGFRESVIDAVGLAAGEKKHLDLVLATMAGRLRRNRIKIMNGDKVSLELSPYDLTKGRITYRHK